MHIRLIHALGGIALMTLAGCSSLGLTSDEPKVEDLSANEIFAQAEAELADGQPTVAAATFNEIERLYPFSQLAKRAIIMSAFSSYQANDFATARASAKRYLDLYPSDEDAAYAQFLIAQTHYDNIVDVGRDQATTAEALNELNNVIAKYPNSDFARDAQLKVDLTLDHLAGKEMEVGRYYLKRGFYTAALNRFRVVIEKYQTTSQTPEALHRIVEANLALGLPDEAQAAAAVLGNNYPGSEWYANTYALMTGRDVLPTPTDDSWWDRVYRQVVQGKWL